MYFQERIIERLKDQREREDRERLEEVDSYKKENKDLKEKVNSLQIELTEKEVSESARRVRRLPLWCEGVEVHPHFDKSK